MPDRLRLPTRYRRILSALLREHLPDVEVWAYGSRVNGRGHEGSDLDLVLRGPGLDRIPLERLMDFEEAVRESTIPFSSTRGTGHGCPSGSGGRSSGSMWCFFRRRAGEARGRRSTARQSRVWWPPSPTHSTSNARTRRP